MSKTLGFSLLGKPENFPLWKEACWKNTEREASSKCIEMLHLKKVSVVKRKDKQLMVPKPSFSEEPA